MKKYLTTILLIAFVIPSVAAASWWNPLSWSIFHKQETPPQIQAEPQKSQDEIINELQRQIDDLKNKQSDSTSSEILTTIKEVKKEVRDIAPKIDTASAIKAQQDALIAQREAIAEQARLDAYTAERDRVIAQLTAENQSTAPAVVPTPPPAADNVLQSFFGYDGKLKITVHHTLRVSDYVKNHKASLNKGVMIYSGRVGGFSQGGANYINVIDKNDYSSSPNFIAFRVNNDDDYTRITNKLDKYDDVIIYGYGIDRVKYNIEGDGGSYESHIPAIEVLSIYKCSDTSKCFNSGEMGNDKIFEKKLK